MQLLPRVLEGGCSCLVDGVLLCNCYPASLKVAVAVWLMEFSCATVTPRP